MIELLVGLSSVTFFAGVVLTAIKAHVALGDFILVVVVGILLAGCNAWAIYKICMVLANFTASWSESRQKWCGGVFILIFMTWTLLSAYIGSRMALAVLRLAT
jgi:hypothetical protein